MLANMDADAVSCSSAERIPDDRAARKTVASGGNGGREARLYLAYSEHRRPPVQRVVGFSRCPIFAGGRNACPCWACPRTGQTPWRQCDGVMEGAVAAARFRAGRLRWNLADAVRVVYIEGYLIKRPAWPCDGVQPQPAVQDRPASSRRSQVRAPEPKRGWRSTCQRLGPPHCRSLPASTNRHSS